MNKFTKGLFVGLSTVLLVGLLGTAWDSTYEGDAGNFGVITDNTQASAIDDHMRGVLQMTVRRDNVEHHKGDDDTTQDDNGLHRLGSARCFFADSAPDDLGSSGNTGIADLLNSQDTSFSGADQLNDSASQSAGGIIDDVGTGRCWIDIDGPDGIDGTLDDYSLYIYVGVAGDDTPSTVIDGWNRVRTDAALPGRKNLIYHGSFEGTDGDGDVAATVVPTGWAVVVTPGISYAAHTIFTEGDGFYLITTGAGAANEGVSQTLTNLSQGTTYRLSARVDSDGSDSCTMSTSGAATEASVTTTSASWTGISDTFVTAAAAYDTVIVRLLSDNDTDVCNWDHVTVYKVDGNPTPGIIVYTDSSTAATASCDTTMGSGNCADIMNVVVDPPGPGYIATVSATVTVLALSTGEVCTAQIHDGSTAVRFTGYESASGSRNAILTLNYTTPTPITTGTPVTFSIDVGSEDASDCNLATAVGGVTMDHTLTVVLTPVN